jgi:chemotaxis family two-component system sensor kinase Cph1
VHDSISRAHQPSFNLTTDPFDCNHEPLHTPGCIQPHGVLLVLDPRDLTILQVSDNVATYLGRPPEEMLGGSLDGVLSQRQARAIGDRLQEDILDRVNPFLVVVRTAPSQRRRFQGLLHRTADRIILELEPCRAEVYRSSIEFYQQFKQAIASVRHAQTLDQLAHGIAQEVQRLSGFARVMIYRFEPDQSGVVIAEAKRADLDSYLGLHYPASDIPAQARAFYYDHWLRLIPDVHYRPARLIPACHPHTQAPLDLSDSVLRSVLPGHLQYLKNMGVAASCSISLINEQRLWGLIVCHHDHPKTLDYETRKACELLGQFLSVEFVRQQERDLVRCQARIQGIQQLLHSHLPLQPDAIAHVFQQHQADVLTLVQAQGAALWINQELYQIGQTPPADATIQLLHWIQRQTRDIYYTDRLAQLYPDALPFKAIASGILSISIVLKHTAYHLLWFRQEQWQTITWAGNPYEQTLELDDHHIPRLSPRGSFQRWSETVRDRALPWQPMDLEAARQFRNTLMVAALEFSQQAMQQLAEQAEQANQAKSQFLAKMSHELRTPLNAILGFTQLMSGSTDLSADYQDYLDIISRSGEHLLSLINDVLEMSKIEAGQTNINATCFDLHRTLQSIEDMFTLRAERQGLGLIVQQAADVPKHIYGDQGKLRQIMINLLGNAVKFTEQGRVTLAVAVVPPPGGGDCPPSDLWLQIQVMDTGPGIHPHDLSAIFKAFQQTERTRQFTEGSGLGLSISRQFARMMGGDLTVQSQLGHGSTFTCLIPVQPTAAVEDDPDPSPMPIVGLKATSSPVRILVVEDVAESRLLLTTLLRGIGFDVREAVSGEDAIAQWHHDHPHLILMDVQMSGMDGLTATRAIRQQQTEQIPRPIILALTANAFDGDRQASLAAGCDDFISKPFQTNDLLHCIRKHLQLEYVYASPAPAPDRPLRPLMPEDLQAMPADWVAELRRAAIVIDEERLLELIADIPPTLPDLAPMLTTLVNNFQLEVIVNLTLPTER